MQLKENCETQNEASTLSGFLEDVALVADIDSLDESTGLCSTDDTAQCERSGIPTCISGRNGRWSVPKLHDDHSRRSGRMEEERRLAMWESQELRKI